MRSAAILALLLCAGQVFALPVNSPMTKGDTKVMKCVVEVISDSLSKPSPMPVSPECLETLQGDERVLSILRHQNLLKELQDLALQGAKERAQQQPKQQAEQQKPQQQHSSFEDELSEVFENQSPEAKHGGGQSESQAVDGGGKTGASEAQLPKGKGEPEHSQQEEDGEDVMAGPPQGLFPGGKSQELEHKQEEEEEEERLSRDWEGKRWSRMDQLAKELTAEKRLEGEDDPDRSMKLPFRARAYGFRDPGPQLRRGWRPSSREDSVEARGDFEEKKEEEGSANRRAEDLELESLSAIEAELEKVAHQLQALRQG
ncbi:chromogranin-A isoform X2 [Peromyscus eremicus]|uniref:chromogranin-A isoform X2 n=1 Tax=Peromyscus eremicus TaxID=42410 RepID=UPI0027DB8241|nr:chromogranin-A isoform X2 [Peromyscus eremicus]